MLCPICLRNVPAFAEFTAPGSPEIGYRCPDCKQSVSPRYVRDYSDYPPVVMNLIGHRGHGKTVYEAGLLLAMRKWSANGFSYQPLDEAALRETRKRTDELQNRQVPESTPVAFQEPTIVRIHPWGEMTGCHLIVYDGGGEAFEQAVTLIRNRDYLARSSTIVWLLSLADLQQPLEELMHLQAVYADAVTRLQGNTRSQYLLVVLTKADLLLAEATLPLLVKEFLLGNEEEMHSHPEKLPELSDAIMNWLKSDPRYANFARTAEQNFAEVRLCVASATGSRPEAGRLIFDPNPVGVLVPIYWLQNFQIPRVMVTPAARAPVNGTASLPAPVPEVYTSLAEAVEKAAADAKITLTAGEHYLKQPLVIDRPLSISGESGETRVIGCRGAFVVKVASPGRTTISGIEFTRSRGQAGDVAWVSQGNPEFQNCSFSNAESRDLNAQEIDGGCGIKITGTAAPKVSGCSLKNNEHAGVFVMDQARPVIEKCIIESNLFGICYEGTSSGQAFGNRTRANKQSGIRIAGHAHPTLAQNDCGHNAVYGIEIAPDATPDLKNQKVVFVGNQGASVQDSRCSLSGTWRLLTEKAKAALKQRGS